MYILGIDGGGTKTAVVLFDDQGRKIGQSTSGPSSIDTVDIEVSIANITQAIQEIVADHGLDPFKIQSIFAGLGGISTPEDEAFVANALEALPFVADDAVVHAKNDAYNALAGGLTNRPDIAIIIGTGTVSFGRDESGKVWRCGGLSYKEGDGGSAYDLGFKAMQAMARGIDGRFERTPFIEAVMKEVGAHTFGEAVKAFETYFEARTEVAQLAKLVTAYADKGDPYALEICDVATDQLALSIEGVDKYLNLKNKEIAIIGSLGNADTIYKKMFIEKVHALNPDFNIHRYELDPVYGSGLLALEQAGIPITDELINTLP